MLCGRPGGYSDSEDSDDDFFFDKPPRRQAWFPVKDDRNEQLTERSLQAAAADGDVDRTLAIINTELAGRVDARLASGWTALLHASAAAQPGVVGALLAAGADVNLHGDSTTPLMALCSNDACGEERVLEAGARLLAAGALLNAGDRYGLTPLMRAAAAGRPALADLLLQHAVNLEMRDAQGWTCVFWAAHHNRADILESLIARGARVDLVDRSGRSPRDIAGAARAQAALAVLRGAGGEEEPEEAPPPDHVDWKDYYPICKEPEYGHEVRALLRGLDCARLLPALGDAELCRVLGAGEAAAAGGLPYLRRRLAVGLRQFHTRGWRLHAVAGLHAHQDTNYSVLALTRALGSHLLQMRVMLATLRYTAARADPAPPAPPAGPAPPAARTHLAAARRHLRALRLAMTQMSSGNLPPADLVRPPAPRPAPRLLPAALALCLLLYGARHLALSLARTR